MKAVDYHIISFFCKFYRNGFSDSSGSARNQHCFCLLYTSQEHPIHDPETEQRMVENMIRLMEENDAPEEQYVRLGLR